VSVLGTAVLSDAAAESATPGQLDREPNLYEYSLLALANMARAEPSLDGRGSEPVQPPLRWNRGLAGAAREHTYDMIDNGCFRHDSCDGEKWSTRVTRHYPGWQYIGENIIGAGWARHMHQGWMSSPAHRSNILSGSFTEFGAGTDVDPDTGFEYGTENFGSRGLVALNSLPMVPAAAVLDPAFMDRPTWDYEFLVNYYDHAGRAPAYVDAVVDGQRYPLSLYAGTTRHGSYRRVFGVPAGTSACRHVYFEVRRSGDDAVVRWPATGTIAFGARDGTCWNPYAPMGGAAPPTTPPGAGDGAPIVVIDAPAAGTAVRGTVEIRAHATDGGSVTRMELYVDGIRKYRRNLASLTRKWSAGAAAVRPGPHTIMVKAWDDAGNVGTASIVVNK